MFYNNTELDPDTKKILMLLQTPSPNNIAESHIHSLIFIDMAILSFMTNLYINQVLLQTYK